MENKEILKQASDILSDFNIEDRSKADNILFIGAADVDGGKTRVVAQLSGDAKNLGITLTRAMQENKNLEHLILASALSYTLANALTGKNDGFGEMLSRSMKAVEKFANRFTVGADGDVTDNKAETGFSKKDAETPDEYKDRIKKLLSDGNLPQDTVDRLLDLLGSIK